MIGLMALQECYECGKSVSTFADRCPHCGAPVLPPAELSDDRPTVTAGGPINNSTSTATADEEELYRSGPLLVTTKRFVVGEKTYAIRGVTSVEVKQLPSLSQSGGGKLGCGAFLALAGVSMFVWGRQDEKGAGFLWTLFGIGLAFFGRWQMSRPGPPPVYAITLRSSSGEKEVYRSTDQAHVRQIATYVTRAIAA
jgi:hypothetical protein